MKQLLRYRFYCLRCHWMYWALGALLVAISLILSNASPSAIAAPLALLGQSVTLQTAGEAEAQAFVNICRNMAACGYLFLVPSVLCGTLVCADYTQTGLIPVVSAGYSRRTVHLVEAFYLTILHLGLLAVIRFLHILTQWEQYRLVGAWVGWDWICLVFFVRGVLSLGNLAVFLLLSTIAARREIVYIPGFLLMAVETLQSQFGELLYALFPTGGIRALFGGIGTLALVCYFVEGAVLMALAVCLPWSISSKLK